MTKAYEATVKEARRVVAAYRSGRIRRFNPMYERNLVTFIETLLRVIDGLRETTADGATRPADQ